MKYTFPRHVIFFYISLLVLTLKGCSREDSDGSRHRRSDSANTNFSSEIVLASYANTEVAGHTFLTLMWHAPYDKPRDAYSVFIHAIDKGGKVLFQFDHKLVNALGLSTNLWDRELIKDVFQLTPPVGHAPGKYTLRVGVWAPENKRWLEVFATNLVQDNNEFFRYKAVLLPDIDCR
jgi:hypothetical protein